MDESLLLARKEGFAGKEALRGEGLEKEKDVLKDASGSAEGKMIAAKKEIDSRMAEVRRALDAEVTLFSKELAAKILGRAVS
jgi:F0F1-type ATP synthase membrane subunit b/b'